MDEDEDDELPSKHMKKDPSTEEDLMEGGIKENGSHSCRAIGDDNNEDALGPER